MAETLRYVTELLDSFPDNTQGLITATTQRDHVISTVVGSAFLEDTTGVNVPISDGVPTIVNPLLVAPTSTTGLWAFDGNNFAITNYQLVADLVIPAGYTKLASFVIVMSLTKSAGGADNYDVQFVKNGVPQGLVEAVQFTAAGTQVVTSILSDLADISGSDTWGIQIEGDGTTDDLTLNNFEMRVTDNVLLVGP